MGVCSIPRGSRRVDRAWQVGTDLRQRGGSGGHRPARGLRRAPADPGPGVGVRLGRRVGARGAGGGGPEDHAGRRQPRRRSRGGHHGHRDPGQDHRARLGWRWRWRCGAQAPGGRHAGQRRQGLAQHLVAGGVAKLHGDRDRHRRQRPADHHHEHVPHAGPGTYVQHRDLRRFGPDLRRGHADHADLQPARSPTGPRSSGRCSSPRPSR